MAYNKDRPVSSRTLRSSAGYLRENFQQLETAISEGHRFDTDGDQDGKHVAPTFVDNGGAPSKPSTTNEARLYNNAGEMRVLYQSGRDDPIRDIPPGTKMLFKQGSAPSGWTFKSEDNDRVIINRSTESAGGGTGGSWTIDGFSFDVVPHALSVTQIPSHNHDMYSNDGHSHRVRVGDGYEHSYHPTGRYLGSYDNGDKIYAAEYDESDYMGEYMIKEDGIHTHDIRYTGSGYGHSHDFNSSHDGNWRPEYCNVITCEKD